MTALPKRTYARLPAVMLAALMALAAGCSNEPRGDAATETSERAAPPASAALPRLTLGVVPQQSASKLAAQWGPLLKLAGERAGVDLVFKTATDIPEFEARCREGVYDFAYMNPYHYTVFHEVGYEAIAKRANAQIKGILVKKRGAAATALSDLGGEEIAFPAPRAFAATLLTTAGLKNAGVAFTPKYVQSHDSVYMNVARGKYVAGGGIVRTLKSVDDDVRSQLEIMWETPGYTPHAFAAHRRVDAGIRRAVTDALVALAGDGDGRALLAPLKMDAIEPAANSDWDDVRALKIQIK